MRYYSILLYFTLCFSFQSFGKTIIDIEVVPGDERQILVYTPTDSKFHFVSRKFLDTDEQGKLQLALDIKKPGLVYLFPQFQLVDDNWSGIPVYVEENAQIKVVLKRISNENPILFYGDFSELNAQMSTFEREFYMDLNNRDKLNKIRDNKSPQENWEFINALRKKELDTIKSLPNTTPDSYQIVEGDINSYYIEIFTALLYTFGDTTINELVIIKEEWMTAIKKNKIDKLVKANGLSSMWSPTSLNFKRDYLFQVNQEKYLTQINGKNNGPNQWKLLEQLLTSQELEANIAHRLYMNMSKSQFDETTLYLYQRFKSEFPEYPYLSTIAPKFEKQLAFLATPKDDIKIIRDSFSSLAEVAKAIDAEYIFIDVWATWCKPCLDEFAHIKPLKAFLDKNKGKIAILYLSYDENRTLDDIEKVVNFHNLEGFHIVGSELLKAELSKNISTEGIMMLPSYAVMDKDGKIVKKKTSRPSQWENLERELLDVINQ